MNAASPIIPRAGAADSAAVPPTRSAKLRRMLQSPQLEFLMEAHNGLSARIVREAGFSGIWASGLSISAQFGVRDNNEASWTQVVDMLEFRPMPAICHPSGWRHGLRQLQQHAAAWCANSSNATSPASASRISSFRDQQLSQRRTSAAGGHPGIRGQDRRRQGFAERFELLHRGARRGVDRGLGHEEALLRAEAYRRRARTRS